MWSPTQQTKPTNLSWAAPFSQILNTPLVAAFLVCFSATSTVLGVIANCTVLAIVSDCWSAAVRTQQPWSMASWRDELRRSVTAARYIADVYGPHCRVNTATHSDRQQQLSTFYQGMHCSVINQRHC